MKKSAGPAAAGVRVLIIFYSFSGQTNSLINRLCAGLKEEGVEVVPEKLRPREPLRFPVGTVPKAVKMMFTTLFRRRIPVQPLSETCFQEYELIVLAGPTWSYNPSGPVLALLDRDGPALFKDRRVLPLISCRGYWSMHWLGLKRLLEKCGAQVPNRLVFSHPNKEPWRTLGVFLKLAGRSPERMSFISRYYKRFGHSREQKEEAQRFGRLLGKCLREGHALGDLDFRTERALP